MRYVEHSGDFFEKKFAQNKKEYFFTNLIKKSFILIIFETNLRSLSFIFLVFIHFARTSLAGFFFTKIYGR